DGIRDFHVTGVQTCALPIWDLLGDRYVSYPAGWDGHRVTGLRGEFARRAVDALWEVLDAATAARVDASPPDWQELERRALAAHRSEEHTSELQSRENLVCRL